MEKKYRTRTFEEGDEQALVALFNDAHESYSGFVPRTTDYWLWCCQKRPDVETEGIIIVEDSQNSKIVGYAVVGKSGNMWEMSVDPDTERKNVLYILFEKVNDYLERVGAEQLILNAPSNDFEMEKVCSEMGFSELKPDQMFVGIVNFEALLPILATNAKEKLADLNETITIQLLNPRQWITPTFSIKVGDEICIVPSADSSSIRITLDSDVLASVILGNITPFRAFSRGQLKVKPISKIFKALKFLNVLQPKVHWFFPLADFG